MKKFLSLVLALVMTMSLVTVAGAKDFTDAADVNYDEAVDVISALEIVGGYADGSFNPEGTLTRGAAAKIICNILVGPETAEELIASSAPYSDVPANHTFAGYIAYCANAGIISGYADGTFRPAATLTGYAFMKMLLGAVGYDAAVEGYTGTNWAINVAQDVVASKLAKGLDGKFNGNKALTREEACLYAFNALMAPKAYYGTKADKITIGDIEFVTGGSEVAYREYKVYEDELGAFYDVLEEVTAEDEDALGRPARTWKIADEKSNIGTYAVAADYVIENELDEEEWDELVEDLDVTMHSELDYDSTANGTIIELFYNEAGDEVEDYAIIAAELVTAEVYAEDLVSTKYDDRALLIDSLYAVADAEENDKEIYANAVELDNFDAIYEAAETAEEDGEDLYVLLITNEAGTKIYSVEIPEIVEAKITRVKGENITAGGEAYVLAGSEDAGYTYAEVGYDLLTVGANGFVYMTDATETEVSDVIYLDKVFEAEEDKWGNLTYTAQIVNEDNEIVEITLAEPTVDDPETEADETAAEDAVNTVLTEGEFYTYEVNKDKEYELTYVEKYATTDMNKDLSYVKVGTAKKYFAADMEVVFIGESGEKLEVVVKEGVQDGAVVAHAVLNSDGDVAVAYVLSAYEDGESDDVLFFEDFTSDANVEDKEGTATVAYAAYLDGEEVEVIVANVGSGEGEVNAPGFYTYTIDADTGAYTLKAKTGYVGLLVGESAGNAVITKDKYVSVDLAEVEGEATKDLDDVTVDGKIYDLTKEGLTTLKAINKWDSETEKATVNFLYDAEEEVITVVYVTFTEVTPAPEA